MEDRKEWKTVFSYSWSWLLSFLQCNTLIAFNRLIANQILRTHIDQFFDSENLHL